jgi:uncharacterized membrane protein
MTLFISTIKLIMVISSDRLNADDLLLILLVRQIVNELIRGTFEVDLR